MPKNKPRWYLQKKKKKKCYAKWLLLLLSPSKCSFYNTTPHFPPLALCHIFFISKTCTWECLPECVPTLARADIWHHSVSLLRVSHAPSYTTARQRGALWPPTAPQGNVLFCVCVWFCACVVGGVKQTDNGGFHTRESGRDRCLLFCPLQEGTGVIKDIVHSPSFTTEALSDKTTATITQGKKWNLQLFTAIKCFSPVITISQLCPLPARKFFQTCNIFSLSTRNVPEMNYSDLEVPRSIDGIYKIAGWWRQWSETNVLSAAYKFD